MNSDHARDKGDRWDCCDRECSRRGQVFSIVQTSRTPYGITLSTTTEATHIAMDGLMRWTTSVSSAWTNKEEKCIIVREDNKGAY